MAAGKKQKHRINQHITSESVRLVDMDGSQVGIVSIADALTKAEQVSLDLVEIAPQAEPPVCRIMDYGKYKFELNKKAQTARKKQKQVHVKEVKFRPGTEEGDYQVKLRNLIRFLNEGDRAKVTMRFRGREFAHQDLGLKFLKRLEVDLNEYGVVEQFPKLEGRQMVMLLAPKK